MLSLVDVVALQPYMLAAAPFDVDLPHVQSLKCTAMPVGFDMNFAALSSSLRQIPTPGSN